PEWTTLLYFSSYEFLIVAVFVWPIWIPTSLYLIEKDTLRRQWIGIGVIIGIFAAIFGLYELVQQGSGVLISHGHIAYEYINATSVFDALINVTFLAYVTAVLGVFFLSSA